nr:GDP-mannose 4,6-dehydratase [Macromonas bipunctata]
MIRAFEAVGGRLVPYRVVSRRPGDIATCYADPTRAECELGWKAQRGLSDMMRDAWRWQSTNPNGYKA